MCHRKAFLRWCSGSQGDHEFPLLGAAIGPFLFAVN